MGDLLLERKATLSDCGRYRYRLLRSWDATRPRALFVMLNPSTADAEVDDATIRSCIRLSRAWGYGGFEVVNLFAWRATDPKELARVDDPVGAGNDEIIRDALAHCDFTICAWGAHRMAETRARDVLRIIRDRQQFAHCLGTTKSGAPKHPLYIKTETVPEVYRP